MKHNIFAAAMVVTTVSAGAAFAASISPEFDTFGALPGASFGGTGIPTDPVAWTTFNGIDGDTLTLGLSATARYSNPAVTDDGAGTYYAEPGENDGLTLPPNDIAARWNFNFFAEVVSVAGRTLADYNLMGFYDFDPGVGTDDSQLGNLTSIALSGIGGSPTLLEGSQNLSFDYLALDAPLLGLTAPIFQPFNADANGEYSFAIRWSADDILPPVDLLTDVPQQLGGQVSINVEVGDLSQVPVPASLLLLISGLGGLGLARRKRAKA